MRHGGFLLWVATVFALATAGQASMGLAEEGPPVDPHPEKPPNILLVLTDDQEESTLAHMPNVQEHLVAKGRAFENAVFTQPLCCPSRASILRGQYPHNTEITSNYLPDGSWKAVEQKGLEQSTVATWLDSAGYDTAYFGKVMNGYAGQPIPGFDERLAYDDLSGKGFHSITDGTGSEDIGSVEGEGMVSRGALEWAARERDVPFFGVVAFGAPHDPYYHPKRTDAMFAGVRAPRNPAFNEKDVSDKPAWVRKKDTLGGRGVKKVDQRYRDALRSLVVVDEFVGKLAQTVPKDTLIVYYTDNGTHTGYHRLRYGKQTPYEQDINFPLLVAGPGVEPGTSEKLVANTDLAPTFADLAGAEAPGFVDGRSIAPLFAGDPEGWRNALLSSNTAGGNGAPVWEAVRTEDETYVEYANGERELYDLGADPHQIENLLYEPAPGSEARAAELSARLVTLENCEAEGCRVAEDALRFPDGPTP